MIQFDEEEQEKKLKNLRTREEEGLAKALAQKYGFKYTDLSVVSINTDALRIVPEEKAKKAKVAAFDLIGNKLKVAIFSPGDPNTKEVLDELSEKYDVVIYMVSRKSLASAWNRYEDLSFAEATREGALDVRAERIEQFLSEVKDLDEIKKEIQKTLSSKEGRQISQTVETIVAGALALKASDIHIEPEEGGVRLRYRLDGLLTDVLTFRSSLYKYILSRIKLLSGVKLNIKAEAQDGRFSINLKDTDIEIRASFIPGSYGESVVLRVLNPESIAGKIETLGIEKGLLNILIREIKRPNGLILNTGPTGSGKTTTLYAFLRKIHTPDVKIITIEDPVEYHLPGIVQTQTKKGYSFAEGLRASLRQDPDVIMVGEIRDSETAEIAINASLTGHLVFSTLHTNNAAGTFPRLIDLGVDPKVIGPAVNASMAQRLVRRLCEKCKKEIKLDPQDKKLVKKVVSGIPNQSMVPEESSWQIFEPGSCKECGGTGYRGRIGIFEVILVDEVIESVVRETASERDIWKRARETQKLPSMLEDGILKVLGGITTLDEVSRVVDLEVEKE